MGGHPRLYTQNGWMDLAQNPDKILFYWILGKSGSTESPMTAFILFQRGPSRFFPFFFVRSLGGLLL